MAYEDLRPSKILTRESFLNAIVATTAIGGSTNAQPHIMAMARHAGVEIEPADWEHGHDVPLLVNMQPAGKYLGERFHRAGGVPAVVNELCRPARSTAEALTVTGRTLAESVAGRESEDREMIAAYDEPLQERAGFQGPLGQPLRLRDHQDERDLRRVPRALPGATKASSRAARSSSTAPTTTTSASTTPTWTSTSALSW